MSLWLDLPADLRARIDAEAPHVGIYLRWEPGQHRPPRGLIWAVYQRAIHAGIGTTRAVRETCAELTIHPSVVWSVIAEENRK